MAPLRVLIRRARRSTWRYVPVVIVCVLVLVWGSATPGASAPNDGELLTALIASMTPEERIGQLVLVNIVGTDTSPGSSIATLLRDYHVGAVHLTASNGNIVNRGDTAAQVAVLTNGLQDRAYEANARTIQNRRLFIPLFIVTDNEGDSFPFSNITHNFTSLPNPMTIGATWDTGHAEQVGRTLGKELSLLGINMLLGPVVDVLGHPRSGGAGDIGTRSFGGDPAWVGALGRAYVRGVHDGSNGRMVTVGKHFPGHGGSDRFTDSEVSTVNKTLEEMQRSELLPFAALTAGNPDDPLGQTDALMTSHIRYRGFQALDPFTRPLSLDPQGLPTAMALPEFAAWRRTGLIVSDALGVLAVKRWYDPTLQTFPSRQIARDALLAGNDLLALIEFSGERGWEEHQAPSIIDTLQFLVQQYRQDPLVRARADDALRRVLALKLKLYPGLTPEQVRSDPLAASAGVGHDHAAMTSLAQDALTLLSPAPEDLAFRLPGGPQKGERILIFECWADCYPYRLIPELDIADTILRLYGPEGTAAVRPEDIRTESFGNLLGWLEHRLAPADGQRVASAAFQADWILFALADYNPASYPASNAAKRFLATAPLDLRDKRLVAFAFNAPYHLDMTEVGKLTAYFAVYSKNSHAIEVAVKALFREIQPRGAAPVSVSGVGYDLSRAVQPDPAQSIVTTVALEESAGGSVVVKTGRIVDRKGHPVPDGAEVTFTLRKSAETVATRTSRTRDGVASAAFPLPQGGHTVQARIGALISGPAAVAGRAANTPLPGPDPPEATTPPEGARSATGAEGLGGAAATAISAGAGLAAAAAALTVALVRRRGRRGTPPEEPAPSPHPAPLPEATEPAPPDAAAGLTIDQKTRRVWVEGREILPSLSPEQYRLLGYLYENGGRVCSREEIVTRVWLDAHVAGVSEEALDALVRRLRERLAQAGATRRYVVTVRGHGFRLDP